MPNKKLMKRKDIEQLENTSLAVVSLIGEQAMDGCENATTCDCGVTVGQICCEDSTVILPCMTGVTV